MSKYLIKFEANWADEFDCEQFSLVEADSVEIVYQNIKDMLTEYEGYIGFGSNQGWEEGEITNENFKVKELFGAEWAVMTYLFPHKTFGLGVL